MIRHYRASDKKHLIKLLELNSPSCFHPSEKADFSQYLDNETEQYYVYLNEQEILGCGGINFGFDQGRTARLSWDMVHPSFQGKHIGSQLVNHRISHLKTNTAIEYVVVRTTQMAYKFYLKFGFKLENIEKNYWETGFDLYYLVLKIK